jgi:hypothetical protein
MGNAAQQAARDITWDKIAERHLEVYRSILNDRHAI